MGTNRFSFVWGMKECQATTPEVHKHIVITQSSHTHSCQCRRVCKLVMWKKVSQEYTVLEVSTEEDKQALLFHSISNYILMNFNMCHAN